ncbi:MAG: hypothetical protein WC613_04275 [Candidatus Aenigmatarchaeota archaeon]
MYTKNHNNYIHILVQIIASVGMNVLFDYRQVDGKLIGIPRGVIGNDNWIYSLDGSPDCVVSRRYGDERRMHIDEIDQSIKKALLTQVTH